MSVVQRVAAGFFAFVMLVVSSTYNDTGDNGVSLAALTCAIVLVLWALRPRVKL